MSNEELKLDEIIALKAIYENEFVVENETCHCYSVKIKPEWSQTDNEKLLKLELKLPEKYPLEESPVFSISAPWMSREDKTNLISELNTICDVQKSESLLYTLIEKAREVVNNIKTNLETDDQPTQVELSSKNASENDEPSNMTIHHGTALVDRRSTFQAHLALVGSTNEVNNVIDQLLRNKKISAATHNIWAYRIVKENGVIYHDCNDDGETAAGSRLLHFMEIVDARNVVVIVSRWYGGIQLGPDRFKHINNVARSLLLKHNYINSPSNEETKNIKKRV